MPPLILSGKIFIYPTDTLYGLGCDATNFEAVKKIREIKSRDQKSFSIIPPSDEWILKNTTITEIPKRGPFTYITKLKNLNAIAKNVHPSDDGEIGIRLPDHWFADEIKKAGVPFVSTSVNKSGAPSMTSWGDLDISIRDRIDCIIYEGPRSGPSSQKIFLL